MPTVPTFAVRETDVSRHNGGTSGVPLKHLRDDSAMRALSSLRGFRGATLMTGNAYEGKDCWRSLCSACEGKKSY